MAKVYFIDVTNRDGVQTSRISLSKLQKTILNLYLAELGIFQSELGFPFMAHERNYIMANLELAELGAMRATRLAGWCRAIVKDVEEALPTGIRYLNLSISTSDQMIVNKFRGKLDRQRVIEEMVAAVLRAKEAGIEGIGVNAEDASRTDLGYLIEFALAAKEARAERIRYCDTVGCDTPSSIYRRIRGLADGAKMAVELHCHNDLGMAVANSISGAQAALDAGYDAYINTTVNGIGERAGQADLLSCILALRFGSGMEAYPIGDPIDLMASWRLGRYASAAFGIPIPINQPGVGSNAFAHEAGIHADGALKDRHNYELYDYEVLGRGEPEVIETGRVITTGEYGGLAGFKHVYEKLGISFADDASAQRILELVQYANAHNQLPLTDDELRFLARYPDQASLILTVSPGGVLARSRGLTKREGLTLPSRVAA